MSLKKRFSFSAIALNLAKDTSSCEFCGFLLQFHMKQTILNAISEIKECEFHSAAVRFKSL